MLVDFLKGNHFSKELATLLWLWKPREPAYPRWVIVGTNPYVGNTYMASVSTCLWARPWDRPGRTVQGVPQAFPS
jgi:hypothetical protein